MAKKKRSGGRPKNVQKRVPKLINYNVETIRVLAALSERYRRDAPPYLQVSDRMIIEALILYADRERLPFSALFGVPEEATK